MTNVNNLAPVVIEKAGLSASVTIPAGTDWTKELYNLLGLVKIEAVDMFLNAEELTVDVLLDIVKSIKEEDIAILTESDLIMSNVNSALAYILEVVELPFEVQIPAGLNWTTELHSLLGLASIEAVDMFLNAETLDLATILDIVRSIKEEDIAILT